MRKPSYSAKTAFTLVELLFSMVILSMIMLVLASITEQTRKIWKQTSQRIDAFSESRTAFEAITRNLSQATLNTYWDYDSATAPTRYVRRSELRFICGSSLVTSGTGQHPGHAVFFQAPLGYVENRGAYNGLENLLNSCGYYVELSDDGVGLDDDGKIKPSSRPSFLDNLSYPLPKRTRFRLMELREPSETLTVYTKTSGDPGYKAADWFTTPLKDAGSSHIVAENVIALVLLPKDPSNQPVVGTALASSYSYNTAPNGWPPATPQPKTENQLPPLLQVTMVAIDESSAQRLHSMGGDPVVTLGLSDLFKNPGYLPDGSVPRYDRDMQTLEAKLQSLHLSYRIFSTEVSIRGAKWSKEQ